MVEAIKERSRITSKGQTTVPKAVRAALGVGYGDEIEFVVTEDGVSVQRGQDSEDDPVVMAFLGFLAQDMTRDPQTVVAFPPALLARMAELTEGVVVDLDEDFGASIHL
jgi:antitoxin PrlF